MPKQTVKELKALAKEKKIKGYYKMKKAELIAALGGSKPEAKEVKEVKAPKKKIIKKIKVAPKEEPKKEPAKKKPIMTKARLRELRKTKPKYPPPAPPTAKTLYDFDPAEQTMYKNKKIKLQKLKQEKESRTKNIAALRKKKDETALEEQRQTNKKKGVPAPKYIRDRANDASQSFSSNSSQIKLVQRDINALEKEIKKMEVDEPQQRKQYTEFEKKLKSKKAVPAKKKVVKKGKAPVQQSGLVIDAAAQAKAEAEGKRIIIDMSGDKPVQRLVKKGKALKSRGKNFNYKGESAPEYKDLDFSNVNMFLRTGRKDYLRNMK